MQCSCMLTASKEVLHHTVTSVSYKEDSIGQRSTVVCVWLPSGSGWLCSFGNLLVYSVECIPNTCI